MFGAVDAPARPSAPPASILARHNLQIAHVGGKVAPGESDAAGIAGGGQGIGHALDRHVRQKAKNIDVVVAADAAVGFTARAAGFARARALPGMVIRTEEMRATEETVTAWALDAVAQ